MSAKRSSTVHGSVNPRIDTGFSAESEGSSIKLFPRKDFHKKTAKLWTCYNFITKPISVTCDNTIANYVMLWFNNN